MVDNSRVCSKYLATKIFSFMVNYGRELRMGVDIRRKGDRVCGEEEED